MLSEVAFENFKALANVKVELGQLTVLVGPNGCGKSTVLEGIEWLLEPGWQKLRALEEKGRAQAVHTSRREGNLIFNGVERSKKLESATVQLRVYFSLPGSAWHNGSITTGQGTWDSTQAGSGLITRRSASLSLCVTRLLLDAVTLGEPTLPTGPGADMNANGKGLAAALAFLSMDDRDRLGRIESDLKKVVPALSRIHFQKVLVQVKKSQVWGESILLEFHGTDPIPAHQVSQGTLIALGILTVLHGKAGPRIILLDDIDRGLHPAAQAVLIRCLKAVLKANPELQIVATSHSPYLVDQLDYSEVRVLWLDKQGHTICKKLTEHPEVERWETRFPAGGFWSSVGEGW